MSNMRRAKRLVALGVGLSLVAMACGGDDDDDTTATTARRRGRGHGDDDRERRDRGASGHRSTVGHDGRRRGGERPKAPRPPATTAMTITVNLNPDAVWEDGTPDHRGRHRVHLAGAAQHAGLDRDRRLRQDHVGLARARATSRSIIEFSEPYGPYKTLFDRIIKKAAVADCNDISADFATEMPISGRQYILQEWSESQSILVPNENYWGDDPAVTEQVVIVPQTDTDTEIASIKAGQVDYIYPQFGDTLGTALQDPNIELEHRERRRLRGAVLPAARGPVRRPGVPRGVLQVDRPPGAVRPDLRPDLRVGRRRGRTAELRSDRPGPVLPRGQLPGDVTTRRLPRRC